VRSALAVLPGFFEFGTHFEGTGATGLFSLNSVLGASIEGQAVRTLNKMRNERDPDEGWPGYRPVRQSQTFPGVLLARQGIRAEGVPHFLPDYRKKILVLFINVLILELVSFP
jgi:hypothetical protein